MKFNDLTLKDLEDKKTFEIIGKGKEFALYRNKDTHEYVLHDIHIDETFSIDNDPDFLEVYELLKKAIKMEESENKC